MLTELRMTSAIDVVQPGPKIMPPKTSTSRIQRGEKRYAYFADRR